MLNDSTQEPQKTHLTTEELLSVVYAELRQMAAKRLMDEPSGQTLQATALVHEVYLRLSSAGSGENWDGRAHFFAAAAEAMRRILIDRARAKSSLKRGGLFERIELGNPVDEKFMSSFDLIDLDDALAKLEQVNFRQSQVVKLRFFVGLTIEQVAEALGISRSTAENDWSYARCWLRVEMSR